MFGRIRIANFHFILFISFCSILFNRFSEYFIFIFIFVFVFIFIFVIFQVQLVWGAYGYFQSDEIKLLNTKPYVPRVTSRSFHSNKLSQNNNENHSNNQNKMKKEMKDKEKEKEKSKNDEDWRSAARNTQYDPTQSLILKQKKSKHSISGDNVRAALRLIKEENKLESLQRSDGRFLYTSPFLLAVVKKLIEDIGLGGQVHLIEFIHPFYFCPVCLSVCLIVCLSVCVSVCRSICLSVCLSMCLSVCLPFFFVFHLYFI